MHSPEGGASTSAAPSTPAATGASAKRWRTLPELQLLALDMVRWLLDVAPFCAGF